MYAKRFWMALAVALVLCAIPAGAALAFGEAPSLAEQAAAGELPPVEERLPAEPLVITPHEAVGTYGGTMYTVAENLRGFGTDLHVIGFEPPLSITRDGLGVRPNVLKDYETEDYQTWTLYFREGMRWSDGAPFTADDMMFWWEDEVQNPEITEVVYIREFQGATIEKIDDHTVVMTLSRPFPMFEYTLATQWGYLGIWWRPKHYLQQYHPSYRDEAELEVLAAEEGYDTVRELYRAKAGWSAKPVRAETPAITAFVPVDQRLETWVWERNPYYFKVDTEGNQLPYIDSHVVREIRDAETIQAQIVSGQVDVEVWHTTLENFALYRANEEDGEYRTLMWQNDRGADVMLLPNQTYEDEALAEVFRDKRFRQALSLAIDREEINEMLYFGLATPRQFTLHPDSRFFQPDWAEAFADYDPDRANALLDDMGLTERDGAGYRLRPDGERLAFAAEYWPSEPETKTPIMELVKDHWAELGIDLALQPQDRSLNAQRASANQIAMNLWHGGGAIDIDWQINSRPPLPAGSITWGLGYNDWMESDGEDGVEPPSEVKHLYELADELSREIDPDRRLEIGTEMWQMQADHLFHIGTVGMAPYPIIVNKDLRNIPEEALWSSLWLHRYNPEHFFFDR